MSAVKAVTARRSRRVAALCSAGQCLLVTAASRELQALNRERERERQTDRQTETQRETERVTDRQKETERDRESDRQTDRQRE